MLRRHFIVLVYYNFHNHWANGIKSNINQLLFVRQCQFLNMLLLHVLLHTCGRISNKLVIVSRQHVIFN